MSTCDLFLGRFQPFHNGHRAIVESMDEDRVIAVVHGEKSSTKDNPIPVKKQVNMIKRVMRDHATIIEVGNGYVPDIIQLIEDKLHMKVKRIFCGADRIGQYKAQINRANKNLDVPLHVEFQETERMTSGSEVREAIRSGDRGAFKANVPRELWDEFTNLAEYMRGQNNG